MAQAGSIGSLKAISPALMNTACAWASDFDQLKSLYNSPYTGAVTTRTGTLHGYNETSSCGVVFVSSSVSSLNSYGYSPFPLSCYVEWVKAILTSALSSSSKGDTVKPFIVSMTASTADELIPMITLVQELRANPALAPLVAIELNTSCPNVPSSSPSGYAPASLLPLLTALSDAHMQDKTLTIGLKLPPYTYRGQFDAIISTLKTFTYESPDGAKMNSFAFLTCTNTLGNSLLFPDQVDDVVSASDEATAEFAVPTAVGGLAGDALHALALGNVHTFHQLLDQDGLRSISIIGVGGVTSPVARARMIKAGASVVGVATLLGKEGVRAFEILSQEG